MSLRNILSGIAAFAALACSPVQAQPSGDITETPSGALRGIAKDGVRAYLGIPYAAPPVGALRWTPPAPARRWSGARDATQFAPFCAQSQRGVFAAPSTSEDCLYLNVFTPAASSAANRPVMVWFHGGGLFSGESNDYDGSKLARDGGVIVVTLNYRVGALGFFSHPTINAEPHPSVNYGIMDQQQALRWVRDNISAFGGDPDNVTIFGQSGGGTSVMAHLVSPLSAGLFHKAINQSGTRIAVIKPETMLSLGGAFSKAAECPEGDVACLRALPVEKVLSLQNDIVRIVSDLPSIDGKVMTRTAMDAFTSGAFNRVPILTGLVQDEQAFFLPELSTKKAMTADDYRRYLQSYGREHAPELEAKYPVEKFDSPSLAAIAVAQHAKACTARILNHAWAQFVPVYSYEFRDRTAPSYFPQTSYPMRAYHTAELQYLFPMFRGGQGTAHPLRPEQARLSDTMVAFWTSFAAHGRPSAPDAPGWDRFQPEKDNYLILKTGQLQQGAGYGAENECEFWKPILNFN